MAARPVGSDLRDKAMVDEELQESDTGIIDEARFGFDLVDGRWN